MLWCNLKIGLCVIHICTGFGYLHLQCKKGVSPKHFGRSTSQSMQYNEIFHISQEVIFFKVSNTSVVLVAVIAAHPCQSYKSIKKILKLSPKCWTSFLLRTCKSMLNKVVNHNSIAENWHKLWSLNIYAIYFLNFCLYKIILKHKAQQIMGKQRCFLFLTLLVLSASQAVGLFQHNFMNLVFVDNRTIGFLTIYYAIRLKVQ